MQVTNALNNNIRILFNPRVEAFKLFDFLIVKSGDDKYLAQIIEIYDDKFDASQNVAKLKLFYRITENDEVMPYDNFTPNKECEIVKVNQEEIENFINQDKKTFIFATNVKNSCSLNIQYDFFNNNPIILADKIENANAISLNLAKKLSGEKHAIIIDSTGVVEFEGAKKIKASKNFRMPLNFTTIDFIFDKCLSDASLEFQAIGGEIINEIKKFAKKQEQGFIPFNAFTRVLLEQYKATPYPELKLLLVRLKKFQMEEVFARTKKDNENLFKTIEKNPITIIDLSTIAASWQKAYLEYIIEDLKDDVYLITRINDENCDVDLINKIYSEKKNIKFIPNVSYNYKKLPSIMQYCKNYILMPSLYQRMDFLDANFALSNLISEGCVIFGENTDNFLYLARDYELEIQEKRKNYRKIALTLIKQAEKEEAENNLEEAQVQNENITKTDSERLMEELHRFESEKEEESVEIEENDEVEDSKEITENADSEEEIDYFKDNEQANSVQEEKTSEAIEALDALKKTSEPEEVKENEKTTTSKENDDFVEVVDKNSNKEENNDSSIEDYVPSKAIADLENSTQDDKEEEHDDFDTTEEKIAEDNEILKKAIIDEDNEDSEDNTENSLVENSSRDEESIDIDDNHEINILDDDIPEIEISKEEDNLIQEEKEEEKKPTIKLSDADIVEFGTDIDEEPKNNNANEINNNEDSENELTDDELDFFQIAKESNMEFEKENSNSEKNENNDIDLSELADNSIDSSFEQIINTKGTQEAESIAIDENTKLNADIIETPVKNDSLPIFKEEIKNTEHAQEFSVGNVIIHKKYGKGTITKTMQYEERQLVQVEFEEAGKKLLDPKVADIKLEQ